MDKKVKISDSPCVKCAEYAECTSTCRKWKEWFRGVWPIVTGQRKERKDATDGERSAE